MQQWRLREAEECGCNQTPFLHNSIVEVNSLWTQPFLGICVTFCMFIKEGTLE
jgi:hypothetical protein